MEIVPVIDKYLNSIPKEEFHRYKSWDNCYQAFDVTEQSENHILHLAFYLASWGMYRGSGGLLQKNHLVHERAVDILFLKKFEGIKCNHEKEDDKSSITEIIALKNKLADHYGGIYFRNSKNERKPISATDTLLSKIMLGTFGCVPAYDRYFLNGLKEVGLKHNIFSKDSLTELFDFIEGNKPQIQRVQEIIQSETNSHYPLMKILDMYFWQIGYDKDVEETNKRG